MTIKIQTPNGQVSLTQDVISTVVGTAVTDNYGVVGMVSKNFFRDNLIEILGQLLQRGCHHPTWG